MSNTKNAGLDILVVDDEASIRRVLQLCLEEAGHRVTQATTSGEALAKAAEASFDIVLLDIRLGNESGMDLIAPFTRRFPWMRIVLMTAHASVETAVRALREGAADYLPKPFSPEELLHIIERVHKVAALESRVAELSPRTPVPDGNPVLQTQSPRMKKVLELVTGIAPTDATVLIRGESGTGKTMLARLIHESSKRGTHPFVVVSCPSLSSELLESELFGHVKGSFTGAHKDYAGRVASAQRGTLFLDEVGEMSPALQAKMLRFAQDREYESVGDTTTKKADVRLITATNVNLENAVKEGRFREDLLFRLNVIEVEMVPLRERPEDIPGIANRLLAQLASQSGRPARGFSKQALQALLAYHWPGNIRELRNVVERCVLLTPGEEVGTDFMPMRMLEGSAGSTPGIGDADGRLATLDELEESHIRRVLAATDSLEAAAEALGIDQTTLYRRRKRYGLA